ncbi:MAG: hypothetical protein KJO43_02835 [Phycisphaerae bacterium]|nr:hypothetical protein [Phycisphaerae bacterium]NNF41700.1 hypothetical protein [Phycisphaerales bacterium]
MTTTPEPASAPDAARRKVTLPTGRLLAAAWIAAAVAGIGWAVVAGTVGPGVDSAVAGLLAAGVVAAASTISLLLLRPWRPKTLLLWPSLWVAASMGRMLIALSGTFLLYSATPYRSRSLWFAAVVAYLAVMVSETRVYASSMRRFAPPGGPAMGSSVSE